MLQRILLYTGVVLILIIIMLVLTAGTFIKTPLGTSENTDDILSGLKIEIQGEQWENAEKSLAQLKNNWEKLLPQIQFSIEREEEMLFEEQLIRLDMAIKYQDKMKAETKYEVLLHTWENLGN